MRTLLLILALVFSTNLFSQERETQARKENTFQGISTLNERESTKQSILSESGYYISKSGEYLQKSANFRYFALGSLAASALMSSIASNTDDQYNGSSNNGEKDIYYAASSVLLVSSIVCTIISINYKMKAGKQLKLSVNGATSSLVYTF